MDPHQRMTFTQKLVLDMLLTENFDVDAAADYLFGQKIIEGMERSFVKEMSDPHGKRLVFVTKMKEKKNPAYRCLMKWLKENYPSLHKSLKKREEHQPKEEKVLLTNLVTFNIPCQKAEHYSNLPKKVNIVLLGKTGNGKSATGNTILGQPMSFSEVEGLRAGTNHIDKKTVTHGDHEIQVVDTPGLFDNTNKRNNEDTMLEIMKMAKEFPTGVNVFLFVCRYDVRFTQEEANVIKNIEDYFGSEIYQHCLLVFTHAEKLVGCSTLEKVLQDQVFLQELLQKTSKRAVAIDNRPGVAHPFKQLDYRSLLLRAIFEVVSLNKGKPFNNLLFEKTFIHLKKKKERHDVLKRIDNYTFSFIVTKCLCKSKKELDYMETHLKVTTDDLKLITKELKKEEYLLITDKDIQECIKNCLDDHKSFLTLSSKKTVEDNALHKETRLSVSQYVQKFISELQGDNLDKVKKIKEVLVSGIPEIIPGTDSDNRYPKHEELTQSLAKAYLDILCEAFKKQHARNRLWDAVHAEGSYIIQEYLRNLSCKERHEAAKIIAKSEVPSNLLCDLLKDIPNDLKTSFKDWDYVTMKFIREALHQDLCLEDSTLRTVLTVLAGAALGGIAAPLVVYLTSTVALTTGALLLNGIVGSVVTGGAVGVSNTYLNSKQKCKICNGRH